MSTYLFGRSRSRQPLGFDLLPILFLLLLLPGQVNAQEDITAPTLVEFSFIPTVIDVSGGLQTVTVRLRITDQLSGFDSGSVQFLSPSEQQFRSSPIFSFFRVSGTAMDGVYEVPVEFPQFSEAGTWRTNQVFIRDVVGNSIAFNQTSLTNLGFPTELQVNENQAPDALCQDVTVSADSSCQALASIDGGSFDPNEDPITLTQDPPEPYPLGDTLVELTATDDQGASATCTATVTVVDDDPPDIQCNAPATIVPPDTPFSFTATADDNCSLITPMITDFACTKKKKGKNKTDACSVEIDGDTITIVEAGGGVKISWRVMATDDDGNTRTASCSVDVVNPAN